VHGGLCADLNGGLNEGEVDDVSAAGAVAGEEVQVVAGWVRVQILLHHEAAERMSDHYRGLGELIGDRAHVLDVISD